MIRKYQPQDLEHIMKIWLETNLAAHGFIPAEYWNEQYEAVKEALPQADILIYEEEGTVLGFLGLQDSFRTILNRFDTTLRNWESWNYIAFSVMLLRKCARKRKV